MTTRPGHEAELWVLHNLVDPRTGLSAEEVLTVASMTYEERIARFDKVLDDAHTAALAEQEWRERYPNTRWRDDFTA